MASRQVMVTQEDAAVQREIDELEARLAAARARLGATTTTTTTPTTMTLTKSSLTDDDAAAAAAQEHRRSLALRPSPSPSPSCSSTHFLLLLADSALPVGSFAFSSGLESYLAHTSNSNVRAGGSFSSFLPLSLSSVAATTLPFVLAAHRDPRALASLDDQLDAAVVCTVGRRASVAQGRALLSIWERSFRPALSSSSTSASASSASSSSSFSSCRAVDASVLSSFSALLRESGSSAAAAAAAGDDDVPPLVSAHLAPLFGVVCALVGLTLRQAAYVFMLSHVKALISAAVRASMFGPYQAQKVLASDQVQRLIDAVVDREWDTPVEDAGQSVPVMDLWVGRHELLYSRIFNS